MAMVERLAQYATAGKQQEFEWDFTKGVEAYETWDEIEVGRSGPGARVFEVAEEDILAFNRSCLETDPMLVDPSTRRPTAVCASIGCSWSRGCLLHRHRHRQLAAFARGPQPRSAHRAVEPFRIGERIRATITHRDKWIRRRRTTSRTRSSCTTRTACSRRSGLTRLILPPDRAELVRYANL